MIPPRPVPRAARSCADPTGHPGNFALGDPDLGVQCVALDVERAIPTERVVQELEAFAEPSAADTGPSELCGCVRDALLVVGAPPHPQGAPQTCFRFVEPAWSESTSAMLQSPKARPSASPALARLDGPRPELDRVFPPSLPVRARSEVVERPRLTLQITEALIDAERATQVRLVTGVTLRRERPSDHETAVRERGLFT